MSSTTQAPSTPTESPQAPDSTLDQVEQANFNQGDVVRASWRFSQDAVNANTAYMRPEAKDLLKWAFLWCIDSAHPLRFDEFADRLGYSTNVIYKAFAGKLRHPTQKTAGGDPALMDLSEDMLKALRSFRRVELTRAKLGRRKFVVTPTARKVFLACDLARESQTPVFLLGASHIGKTESFREYCVANNHGKSVLIELEAVNGQQGLVRAVAARLGISPNGNSTDLTERIKRALTPDMVLIFDEVHLLANVYRRGSFFACLEWIRRLYDFCQCGIVLSFTELGFQDVEKARKRELEQIFRRGVHRTNLGARPSLKDVAAVVQAWGLEFPARADVVEVDLGRGVIATEQPWKMLEQLSRDQGLKAIIERLRYASKFAADDAGGVLSWAHVAKAHLTISRSAQEPEHGWGNS